MTSTKRSQTNDDEDGAKNDVTHPYRGVTIPPQVEQLVCSSEQSDQRKHEGNARTNGNQESEHDGANRDDQGPGRAIADSIEDAIEKVDGSGRPLRVRQRLEGHELRLTLLERDASEYRLVRIARAARWAHTCFAECNQDVLRGLGE